MTAKERLHKLVDELSEREADDTLRFAAARHRGSHVEEWGDLDAQTGCAAARVMRDLDEEERAELGETIAEAWGYERPQ